MAKSPTSDEHSTGDEPSKAVRAHIRTQRFMIWFISLALAVLSCYLGAGMMAEKADWNGEQVTKPSCMILDKSSIWSKGMHFKVESTCGIYQTDEKLWNAVEVGKVYILRSTKGNWAHRTYLLSAHMMPSAPSE